MSEDPLTIGTGHKIVGSNWFFEKKESLPLHLEMRATIVAVGRPCRLKLRCFFRRQALRFSAARISSQIQRVQMGHRGEGELLPVGRFGGVVNQADLDWSLFYFLRKIKFRSKVLRNFRRERNHGFGSGVQVEAANFSVLVIDNFFSAGHERIAGEKIAREN